MKGTNLTRKERGWRIVGVVALVIGLGIFGILQRVPGTLDSERAPVDAARGQARHGVTSSVSPVSHATPPAPVPTNNAVDVCDELGEAAAIRERDGITACREELQSASCFPPLDFDGRTSTVDATYSFLQDSLLKGCELAPGDLVVDCSEYPCITFLAPDAVGESAGCGITNYFQKSPDSVWAEVDGQKWHYMVMLRPGEQKKMELQAVTGRWKERLRRAAPALASGAKDGTSVRISCAAQSALVQAQGHEAECAALLNYWGCDQPDTDRYANAMEAAEEEMRLRLDPDCATLRRDDVHIDCTTEPCTFSFMVEKEDVFCNFGEGDIVTQLTKQYDFGTVSVTPILHMGDPDRDVLEGEFFDVDSLRLHHAANLMRARMTPSP